jgi:S-adenosyl-L-methionine hydrolase (adenosine-forming)
MPSGIVALLTDFGYRDPFVGAMKGVMVGINPALQLIDISHDIRPQHIREAAIVLSVTYRCFAPGTIFVVVVDPGVGGARRALVAETADHLFVAPDNGVLGPVLDLAAIRRVIHATDARYFRKPVSRTFHGRDVFAPLAAWLSRGIDPGVMGSTIDDYVRLQLPQPCGHADGMLEGEVIYQDRFGNLITNLSEIWLTQRWGAAPWLGVVAQVETSIVHGLDAYYAQRAPHELGLVVNSWGLLEIFANGGHAGRMTGAREGSRVCMRRQVSEQHTARSATQENRASDADRP